ncbi:prepilin-type N-terminal cleavage/methylation domain-containing protein [Salinibacterium sp.]|uniref:PulJ/GspJ family protein n=1 Tax=Salinibacterium sp. TaxID=1915057 RepID=UPI00286B616A|nr:prepilin-type N-terminal cleavage/methylation domain-containing protein [Salinibacterium sp.]
MADHIFTAPGEPDRGYTIIEVIVSIGIFTLFIAMMLTTIVAISQSSTRTQLVGESTNGAITVFGALDRQVRYSDAINYPGPLLPGKQYVEFRTPAESTATRVTTCTQWMFDPAEKSLSSRTWPDVAGSTETPWVIRLSNVIDDQTTGSSYPFTLVPVGLSGSSMQKLVVALHAGNQALDQGAQFTSSFVARNSSTKSPSNADVDANLVSDTPVCVRTGSRS